MDDDELQQVLNRYEQGLAEAGIDASNVDYDALANVRQKFKADSNAWAEKRAKQQVREARLAELAQFKPVAESWVERHHSYLGVNYLDKRIAALTNKEQNHDMDTSKIN